MTRNTKVPRLSENVYAREDSSNLQFRIKVPVDLKPQYGGKVWAMNCSLKTSDIREANRKAAELRAHWLAVFEQQRKRPEAPRKLEGYTPDVVKLLADTVRHYVLNFDSLVRVDPRSWFTENEDHHQFKYTGMPDPVADAGATFNRETAARLSQALARGRLTEGSPYLAEAAVRVGIAVDADAPGYGDALRACLTAAAEAYSLTSGRDQGQLVETPPAPSIERAERAKYLRDAFDLWRASRDEATDSVRNAATLLKMYEEQTGNPPLSELRREQGVAFKAWVMQRPQWESKTQRDRFDSLKGLLNFAAEDLDWIVKNPWKGLNIPYSKKNKRKPWTPVQVETFFSQPLFTEYQLPKANSKNGGAAAYWIPLLGLFTGARVGELAQLRVIDVVEDSGVWSISINDEGVDSTVKTEAGQREVPIHSELLRLGFLEYVTSLRASDEERLWPALTLRKGKPGSYFSQWFGEFRKGIAPVAPDFHSLRHTVRSKMTRAGIAEQTQDRITGHETKGSIGTRVYGSHHDAEMLRAAVESIKYPELTLPVTFSAPIAKPFS